MAGDTPQGSGSSEDFGPVRQDQPIDRLNQVIRNFHTKAALIILHSRVNLKPAYSKGTDTRRVNKWFNIELDETEDYKDDIRPWKTCDLKEERPPPLVIEIYINLDTLNQGQRLVLLDEDGKRWDVKTALESFSDVRTGKRRAMPDHELVVERWNIELGDQTNALPSDMANLLPLVYKKSIVLFRSLFTYCNFLPAFKLSRKLNRGRSSGMVKLNYRIIDPRQSPVRPPTDSLSIPLCESSGSVSSEYSFGVTESPAGPFSVSVAYRQNCDFQIDSSEELLSRQILASDDAIFKPSLPGDESNAISRTSNAQEVGSLPVDHRRNLIERPELGHAYGSLSTFHQAGISTGTSPISALRNAQDLGADPSPPRNQDKGIQPLSSNESSRASLKPADGTRRRSSFSFQPFKTPVLSASPLAASPLGQSPRPTPGRSPTTALLAEERGVSSTNMRAHIARKSISNGPDAPIPSSTSSSPKPAPMTRYSSSFSHRRARLSSGGTPKPEDEQSSSGRTSAASSAHPGSGLVTETPTGAPATGDFMQEDDENITGFLQMLDMNKGLLTPADSASAEASTKRTAAALMRFHRMRDSNAALSDSMSSSMLGPRSSSSSSRQLSSVPAMIAATSVSTASSPGKPISPHTPHTPFAPSRLSAAYSHDDDTTGERLLPIEEPPSPTEPEQSDPTVRGNSNALVPPIEIPTSPPPYMIGYRRSSSARRETLGTVEDIADLYGMRSASMGAQDRRAARREADRPANRTDRPATAAERVDNLLSKPKRDVPVQSALNRERLTPAEDRDDTGRVTSTAGPPSTHPYPSHLARGSRTRALTPPQGSSSSFGVTPGGSLERDRDSAGSTGSGSWGRSHRRRTGSKTENRFEDEEFLFAMEKSDFTTANPGATAGGESSKR